MKKKDPNHLQFLDGKEDVLLKLQELRDRLVTCVDEGMIDLEDAFYNELLALIDETELSKNWDELLEVITKAKTLEVDIAAWLARHGKSGISMSWPKKS